MPYTYTCRRTCQRASQDRAVLSMINANKAENHQMQDAHTPVLGTLEAPTSAYPTLDSPQIHRVPSLSTYYPTFAPQACSACLKSLHAANYIHLVVIIDSVYLASIRTGNNPSFI